MLCSGILFGYYWLMLRNKIYHRYNRFYLLASVVIALLLPFLKIEIQHHADEAPSQAIQLLQVVSSSDTFVETYVPEQPVTYFTTAQWGIILYLAISSLLAIGFMRMLWVIRRMIRTYKGQVVDRYFFISTAAKNTPFSFLNYVFWNEAIDLESETGKRIFRHEVAHMRERHSLDKLMIHLVLIACWCNPFFWLIRKELTMIHEFIADQKAVEDSDTATFAAMILQAAYPGHQLNLVSPFFYSPIKRRLLMLTKNQNPRVSYFSRILVLPLVAFIIAAFSLKPTTVSNMAALSDQNTFTILIDAGHGGKDNGALGAGGVYEKDLNLAIAQKIKALNTDPQFRIVLTRETDVLLSPQERTAITRRENADVFISIHMDAQSGKGEKNKTGFSVYIPKDEASNAASSRVLASAVINQFKTNFGIPVADNPAQREIGIWVLQNAQCPAVIIEAGYITNTKDLGYLREANTHELFARHILNAIRQFLQQPSATTLPVPAAVGKRTVAPNPAIAAAPQKAPEYTEEATVTATPQVMIDASERVIIKSDLSGTTIFEKPNKRLTINGDTSFNAASPLYLIDGRKVKKEALTSDLNPMDVQTIDVIKGEDAVRIYGDEGKNGVIRVTTKSKMQSNPAITAAPKLNVVTAEQDAQQPQVLFTKTEQPPVYSKGSDAWSAFITNKINKTVATQQGWAKGTHKIKVKFVVEKDGSLSDIRVNATDNKAFNYVANVISESSKWKPAVQNGNTVRCLHEQEITITVD